MSNYPDGYYKNKKTGSDRRMSKPNFYKTQMTIEEVKAFPTLAIEERGITEDTCRKLGIRTELSGSDGVTPVAHYFPYSVEGKLVGYKKRDLTLPKIQDGHFSTIGFQSVKCDLFGAANCSKTGAKKIFICEGEYDQAIVWQVLKARYPKTKPAVVSISNGTAGAVLNIGQKHNMKFLKKFSEVILCFDNDGATSEEKLRGIKKGKEATADVYGLLPDIKVVPLPDDKDPCESYEMLGENEFYWSLMKPIQYTPEGFVKYEEIRNKAIELPVLGKGWPWESVYRKTLGRRIGEGYYFGAGVKMGKSVIVDTLTEYIITNDKNKMGEPQKVALFKFEEQPDETVKKVAGKFYRKDFSNPEKIIFISEGGKEVDVWGEPIRDNSSYFNPSELESAVDSIGDKVVMYNNYGRCNWDELKGAIRHAVLVEHIEDIFIDPITRLTAGMTAAEANTELERFADEISKMSQDLGFTYYCFCHLKSPDNRSTPHEHGGKVMSSQFRGSRSMMQACHYMFGLEGNKDPEQPEKVQNTRYFVILDDRKYGRTARIPLFYDVDTGVLAEPPQGFLEDEVCQTLEAWKEMGGYTPTPSPNFTSPSSKKEDKDEEPDEVLTQGLVENDETGYEEGAPF